MAKRKSDIRDRVKELRRVRAGDLRPNPKNWRTHPQAQQDAIRGVLAEIGYADALLARELPDGSLMLLDGHLRRDTTPDQKVPVLILDVTEAESDKLLVTLDPLAAMVEANAEALEKLLAEVETDNKAVEAMLAELGGSAGISDDREVELRQLGTQVPPKMAWVLIGLPTVRYGEIAETMERLAGVEGIVLETTVNDG